MGENYFVALNRINVNDKVENKNGLIYLSWAWAWGELKKLHPDATYTIYENSGGWNYHTDGRTAWVKTGVTVNGIEHIEYLPVMDHRNRSIPLDNITSFDVNKTLQRSLTKAVARHGLGLYIYAGEDLPDDAQAKGLRDAEDAVRRFNEPPKEIVCEECGNTVLGYKGKNGDDVTPEKHVAFTQKQFGKTLCLSCAKEQKKNKGV